MFLMYLLQKTLRFVQLKLFVLRQFFSTKKNRLHDDITGIVERAIQSVPEGKWQKATIVALWLMMQTVTLTLIVVLVVLRPVLFLN